jgi:hypothetical protein
MMIHRAKGEMGWINEDQSIGWINDDDDWLLMTFASFNFNLQV